MTKKITKKLAAKSAKKSPQKSAKKSLVKAHSKSAGRIIKKRKTTRIHQWTTWSPAPVIGIDEVGRGCLAGPVYAAAVVLNLDFKYKHFTDSKVLSAERREELSGEILKNHWVGVGFATVEEIDEINILQASFLAMNRAVKELTLRFASLGLHEMVQVSKIDLGHGPTLKMAHVVVDGHMKIRGLPVHFAQTPVVGGDLRVAPVSAASIVAKVARDRFMIDLKEQFPGYGFEAHKGYGTKQHQAALKTFGPCPFHRRSFNGVLPTDDEGNPV